MNLKFRGVEAAVAAVKAAGVLRQSAIPTLPTPLDVVAAWTDYNPTFDLWYSVQELQGLGQITEMTDYSTVELLNATQGKYLINVWLTASILDQLIFVNSVDRLRDYLLGIIYRCYAEAIASIPAGISKKFSGLPSAKERDADFFDLIDKRYSLGLPQLVSLIDQDLGVKILTCRFTFLKVYRFLEMRNCFVHHAGTRSNKFQRVIGSSFDKSAHPNKLKSPISRLSILYVARVMKSIDMSFKRDLKIPGVFAI